MTYLVYAKLEIDRPAQTVQVKADTALDARCKILQQYPEAIIYTTHYTKVVYVNNVIHVDFKTKRIIKRTG